MIKKNQFALIFLTIVTMLAVWYIKTPVGAESDPEIETSGQIEEFTRLPELVAMREAVRAERSLSASVLDGVIADASSSLTQKEVALNEKKGLSTLTETEVLLEVSIIAKGYRDCFVHASSNGVTVLVISETSSAKVANELITMALDKFGDSYNTVVVNFKTIEEVKS